MTRPHSAHTRVFHAVDWVIVAITLCLVVLSLVNLNSAGNGDWTGRVATQARWVLLGSVGMVVIAFTDSRHIYALAYVAYGLGMVLLALVPLVGVTVNHSQRWLGTAGLRLQPSELMKVLVVLALARMLHDVTAIERPSWKRRLMPFALVLLPSLLIVRQPDLGTTVMLLLVAFSVFAMNGVRWRFVLVAALAGVMWGWRYMLDYQRLRIDVWLNPELYADTHGYQTVQAMVSVGNGGLLGRGIGQGSQNVLGYLPEPFTDFPFAVYAEEWGFVGGAMMLLLCMAMTLWALNLASQARDRFAALVSVGVGALFFWHVTINVGMVLQIVPVSGITLPFFSAGGSSVLALMLGLGVLMSVSRSRHRD